MRMMLKHLNKSKRMKTVADKCIKQKEDDQMSFIEPKDLKKLKEIVSTHLGA